MRAVLVILLAASCSPVSPPRTVSAGPPPSLVSNQSTSSDARAAVDRADHALATSMPIDYARPIDGRPFDRTETLGLFLEACRGGERAACWVAWQLDPEDLRAAKLVATNCLAGDTASCRALPQEGFATAPGKLGRDAVCRQGPTEYCATSTLREECQHGFPWSCHALGEPSAKLPDREALATRALELALPGCSARILDECEIVRLHGSDGQRIAAMQTRCAFSGDCYHLALHAMQNGERARARELYERSCQYARDAMACSDLALAYLNRTLDEPVPGRGRALAAWACERIRAIRRDDDAIPACLAAKNP